MKIPNNWGEEFDKLVKAAVGKDDFFGTTDLKSTVRNFIAMQKEASYEQGRKDERERCAEIARSQRNNPAIIEPVKQAGEAIATAIEEGEV